MVTRVFINLERSPERRVHMQNIMKNIGYEFEYIEAIDGRKVYPNVVMNKNITPGRNGCMASHVKALDYCLSTSSDTFIVSEDDITDEYVQFWKKEHHEFMNGYLPGCDILQMCMMGKYDNDEMIPIDRQRDFWSTGIYSINRNTAQSIVDTFKHRDIINMNAITNPVADDTIYYYGKTMSIPMFSYVRSAYSLVMDTQSNENPKYKAMRVHIESLWRNLT
jgi:hypothetical protein